MLRDCAPAIQSATTDEDGAILRLGISRSTLRREVSAGRSTPTRIRGRVLYRLDVLDAYLDAQTVGGAA